MSHTRLARPACFARPACPARPAHDTPDIHALPALSPVARASLITRPAACGVHCMPSYALCPQPGTENAQYAEKRHEVAKCQRFGAVNRPQIIEIMFSCIASCCVSVRNVLIDWKIVKWLDKMPFCGVRVWHSCWQYDTRGKRGRVGGIGQGWQGRKLPALLSVSGCPPCLPVFLYICPARCASSAQAVGHAHAGRRRHAHAGAGATPRGGRVPLRTLHIAERELL